MKKCPSHIECHAVPASDTFSESADAFHHYFQVVCSCGSILFVLLMGSLRSVHAICHKCRSMICLYDLSKYPTATKEKGEEVFKVHALTMEGKAIYVGYEYGELDDDQEFDQDDISWFELFVETNGKPLRVFSDESA
jgi:hypothetical protein